MSSPEATSSKGHGKQLELALLLSAVAALSPLSIDLYLPAMPAMGRQLQADPAALQMTLAVFMIGSGLGQLLFGPLSDRYGRRWPALGGLALNLAACVGCALAVSAEQLVLLRFLEALGVCAAQVAARAILADLFEPREMARFSALINMISLLAPLLAPLIGGAIFTALGWRPIFWVLAGYGAAVMLIILLRLPETQGREARRTARGESAVASYWQILRNWPLMHMALVSGFAMGALGVYLGGLPHLLIEHYGVPPGLFGLYFGANSLGLMVGATVNRRLLKRHEPLYVLRRASLVFLGAAAVFLAVSLIPHASKWAVLAPLLVIIATFPTVMNNPMAVAQGMDRARAGGVAAILGATSSAMSFVTVTGVAAMTEVLGDTGPRVMGMMMMASASAAAGLFFLGGPKPRRRF